MRCAVVDGRTEVWLAVAAMSSTHASDVGHRRSAGFEAHAMDLQTNGGRSLASVVAEQLAATVCRQSTSSTPDVVEAVNLTGSTSAKTWTSQTPRPLHGICAAGVRTTS